MSFFFGGSGKKVKPQFTGLAVQTSASTLPITLAAGVCRISPNIIWQDDFKAHKQKQKAGKGGGSVTSYTYTASYQLGLCWGPITNIIKTWKNQEKFTGYTPLGFTLFTGTDPQAPWGYLVTAHPTKALGYSGIAHLDVANYDLENSNSFPQHSFEAQALLFNTQIDGEGDADPALWIELFLEHDVYGAIPGGLTLIDSSTLLSGPNATTTGDAAFQTYCRAMGFGMSPALQSQEKANSSLNKWARLFNTALVWTGYSLRFVPYGSESLTAHGVTYLPDVTVRYSLSSADFILEGDPISFNRIDPADGKNSVVLQIKDRSNEYNSVPAEWRDQGLVDQFGLKPADSIVAEEICVKDMGARMAALIGQRIAYIRNEYEIHLGPQYCLLEPMDILELYDSRWGYFNVLINHIQEDDNDSLTLTCEEYHGSVSLSGPVSNVPIENNPINQGQDAGPVNPPLLLQVPPSLTSGRREVWAVVSGGDGTNYDEFWGGAQVYISTDGGTAYNMVGTIDAPARQGKLTDALAAIATANPDIINDLKITSAMSNAEFSDATAADAEAGVTLSYIAAEGVNTEEYLSYTDTLLTGTNLYTLSDLYRGLHGTIKGAHAIGANFARLDSDAVFKYEFPVELEGSTIFVKFVSFNVWNSGLQELSAAVAYSITLHSNYTYGIGVEDLNDVTGTPADGDVLVWDSGTNSWVAGPPLAGTSYGFAFGPKTPAINKILAAFDTPIAWTLPASLTNSQGTIIDSDTATAAAPSSQTDFDIQSPLGVSLGTMRFAIGSLTATFINTVEDNVAIGGVVYIIAPASLNGITGAITGSILGTR